MEGRISIFKAFFKAVIFCFRIFGRVEKTIFGKVVAIMPRDRKWPSAVTVGVLAQVINFIVYTNLLSCTILALE